MIITTSFLMGGLVFVAYFLDKFFAKKIKTWEKIINPLASLSLFLLLILHVFPESAELLNFPKIPFTTFAIAIGVFILHFIPHKNCQCGQISVVKKIGLLAIILHAFFDGMALEFFSNNVVELDNHTHNDHWLLSFSFLIHRLAISLVLVILVKTFSRTFKWLFFILFALATPLGLFFAHHLLLSFLELENIEFNLILGFLNLIIGLGVILCIHTLQIPFFHQKFYKK